MSFNPLNIISGMNGILGIADKIGGALNGEKNQIARKEEAEKRRKQVEQCLVDVAASKTMAEQQVERVLLQARKKGITASAKKALYVKWRIAQQQADYMNSMYDNLLMIQSRMQVSDMTVAFGEAIGNVTEIIKRNNKDTPDFNALMKKFNQQISPINEMIGENMTSINHMLSDIEVNENDMYNLDRFESEIAGVKKPAEKTEPDPMLAEFEAAVTGSSVTATGDTENPAPVQEQSQNTEVLKELQKLAEELGGVK